jgi:glycosyltransferase involved in cell wall biosynthesis
LKARRSGWIYGIDLGIPAAPLAALRRKLRPSVELIYEIGDPARPLLANQNRPGWEVALADALDRRLPAAADRLVFRGSYLADYFAGLVPGGRLPPWIWLPDGADLSAFAPRRDDPAVVALKKQHGLEDQFVVGIVGSIHYNPAFDWYYGWDLAEALALIPADRPIVGVVVGDGPGRSVLEAARERLRLGDRLKLVGRAARDEVPLWVNAFDVGLSTQTDDPVGWGRTTAKLPEYLGCGTVVVATDVGEAHRWLGPSGQTLPYRGLRDDGYPARLAARLLALSEQDLDPLRADNRALAERLFDYGVLRRRLAAFLAGGPAESPEPDPPVSAPLPHARS